MSVRHAVPCLAAIAALGLSACAHTSADTSPAVRHAPTASAAPAAALRLSAEQMLTRLLELIRTSARLEDFTVERLSRTMGVPVQRASDQSQRYGYGEALDAQWNQNFEVDPQRTIGARFNFSFDPIAPDANPPLAELCRLDYPRFTAALEEMGFKRTPYRGEHGRFINDNFDRPGMRVAVYPQGEVSASGQSTGRVCVKRVQVF